VPDVKNRMVHASMVIYLLAICDRQTDKAVIANCNALSDAQEVVFNRHSENWF